MIDRLLLALHLLAAVIWVGGMVFALFVLWPSLAVLSSADRLALYKQVFRRFFLWVWYAATTVILTGYAMVFGVYGGYRYLGWNVQLMNLLGLIMAGIFLWMFLFPWYQLRSSDHAPAVESIRRLLFANLLLGIMTIAVAAWR